MPEPMANEISGDVEAVRHYEGDEEHGEDPSTGPVESPDGQLAEPCARSRVPFGHRSLGPRPSTAMSKGLPTGTKGRIGPGLGVGGDPGGIVGLTAPVTSPGPMARRY